MDINIAAWMIAGGPRIETEADQRERDHLRVLLASRAAEHVGRPGPLARLAAIVRPAPAAVRPVCCPA